MLGLEASSTRIEDGFRKTKKFDNKNQTLTLEGKTAIQDSSILNRILPTIWNKKGNDSKILFCRTQSDSETIEIIKIFK